MATFVMWTGYSPAGSYFFDSFGKSPFMYGSWSRKAATTQLLKHFLLGCFLIHRPSDQGLICGNLPCFFVRLTWQKRATCFLRTWTPRESQWSLDGEFLVWNQDKSRTWQSNSPLPNLEETEVLFGNFRQFFGSCPGARSIPVTTENRSFFLAKHSARQQVSLKSVCQGCKHTTP